MFKAINLEYLVTAQHPELYRKISIIQAEIALFNYKSAKSPHILPANQFDILQFCKLHFWENGPPCPPKVKFCDPP